jgi:hypothetical protein
MNTIFGSRWTGRRFAANVNDGAAASNVFTKLRREIMKEIC